MSQQMSKAKVRKRSIFAKMQSISTPRQTDWIDNTILIYVNASEESEELIKTMIYCFLLQEVGNAISAWRMKVGVFDCQLYDM